MCVYVVLLYVVLFDALFYVKSVQHPLGTLSVKRLYNFIWVLEFTIQELLCVKLIAFILYYFYYSLSFINSLRILNIAF